MSSMPAIPIKMPTTAVHLDDAVLRPFLPFSALVPRLFAFLPPLSFAVAAPARLPSSLLTVSSSSALLLMPSWSSDADALPYLGVKIVTSFPLLRHHLRPLASFDGSSHTIICTATDFALASSLLVGPSSLAPLLFAAHHLVRPSINRVIIWNRTPHKARTLAEQL